MSEIISFADRRRAVLIRKAKAWLRQYGFTDRDLEGGMSISTDDPRLQLFVADTFNRLERERHG